MNEAANAYLFALRISSSFSTPLRRRKSISPLRLVMSISGPSVFIVYLM